MNLVPAFGPQFDGFITTVLMIFSLVCLLSVLPSVVAGVLCARAMSYLNSFLVIMLSIGMGIAAYALSFVLNVLAIPLYFHIDDEVIIVAIVIVSAIVGAAGAAATWRTCVAWNRRRQNRFS